MGIPKVTQASPEAPDLSTERWSRRTQSGQPNSRTQVVSLLARRARCNLITLDGTRLCYFTLQSLLDSHEEI